MDSLKSAEDEVGTVEQEEARRSAARYFALSYRYTWSYTPFLVVVAGLSGTGKSTVATALQTHTGFAHINSDVVRKQLAGFPPNSRGTADLYVAAHSARTYRSMYASAADSLAHGRGVIIDATFQRRIDRDAARTIARERGVPFVIAECECSADEVRRRLTERGRRGDGPSDADCGVYLEQRRRYEQFAPDEPSDAVTVNSNAPTGEVVAAIESALRRLAVRCKTPPNASTGMS